jgi:hypothetical protein
MGGDRPTAGERPDGAMNANNGSLKTAGLLAAVLAAVVTPLWTMISYQGSRTAELERLIQKHLTRPHAAHAEMGVLDERLTTLRRQHEDFVRALDHRLNELDTKLQIEIRAQAAVKEDTLRMTDEKLRIATQEREVLRMRVRDVELALAAIKGKP